ncbi:MAG: transposase, partial [Bacteroidales bacterium]|nr:transposase [Bacteroidales bacterium]
MKRKRFSSQEIATILKEFENGKSVQDITREYGV